MQKLDIMRDGWGALGWSGVVLTLLFGVGCGEESTPKPEPVPLPNIVLITLDTTRADHLGYHGYSRDTSPFMDSLAAESIVFDRCIVPMATTLPTHISILTGVWPLEHGVLANANEGGQRFLPAPGLRSFAEFAQEEGYATVAFVSAAPLKGDSGVASGFDKFHQPTSWAATGDATTGRAVAWLKDKGNSSPFFMWVHYFDAHWPTNAPEEYQSLFSTDAGLKEWMQERQFVDSATRLNSDTPVQTVLTLNEYDADLRFQDDQLKQLVTTLRARPDWERTAVVVVGDHGDGLGQHNELAHGGTWMEQLHAPFLMRVPGEAPRRVSNTTSAADVLPTLLARMDLSCFDEFVQQCSGQDALRPNGASARVVSQDTSRGAVGGNYRWSLTGPRWKYFRVGVSDGGPDEELYDLDTDPYELNDVSEAHPAITAEHRSYLAQELLRQNERGKKLRAGAAVSKPAAPGIQEELEALGYTGDDKK